MGQFSLPGTPAHGIHRLEWPRAMSRFKPLPLEIEWCPVRTGLGREQLIDKNNGSSQYSRYGIHRSFLMSRKNSVSIPSGVEVIMDNNVSPASTPLMDYIAYRKRIHPWRFCLVGV
jgi:hypothetical protein